MFGRQLKLKQARHALRDGRLEEAFRIVTDLSVRQHKGAQDLLRDLVNPLMERASSHLDAGRLENALLDVERAIEAGGNRPDVSEQREAILASLRDRKTNEERARELLQSARRHLRNGSLHATRERLEQAPTNDAATTGLRNEADASQRKGASALKRACAHLERKEILEAVEAAEILITHWGRNDDTHTLLSDLKIAGTRALLSAFEGGDLHLATTLHHRLRAVLDDSVELRRFDEALDLSLRAQQGFGNGKFDEARTSLGRLDKLFPGVTWIVDALGDLSSVSDGLRSLRTGPLGDFDRQTAAPLTLTDETLQPAARPRANDTHPAPVPNPDSYEASTDRSLLWIDGLGTFLILQAPRVSIGRVGSTSRPDLALTADLAGYHAEISRSGEDYFVTAIQGDVRVGGRKVQKKLLTDDDALELGKRCRIRFGQPTSMSATALLDLRKGMRIEGDVKTIVLLDDNLIVGPGANCHIRAPMLNSRFLIQKGKDGLLCRAEQGIVVDGKDSGLDVEIQPGTRLQVEDLTFTVTGVSDRE
jgi:tetratricopeptide (TPR) repeat protein